MRVAVIGAGPAGMTAALQLSRGGVEVDVYEAGPCVGGLARSLDLWGQRVDLGPHRFFSTDARVNRLWLDVVGQRVRDGRSPHAHLLQRAGSLHYPLKPLNAFWNMGLAEAASCLASYLKEQLRAAALRRRTTCRSSRGSCAALAAGCSRCSSSLTARSCGESLASELSADFAAQRIKKLSLPEAVKSALSTAESKAAQDFGRSFPLSAGRNRFGVRENGRPAA